MTIFIQGKTNDQSICRRVGDIPRKRCHQTCRSHRPFEGWQAATTGDVVLPMPPVTAGITVVARAHELTKYLTLNLDQLKPKLQAVVEASLTRAAASIGHGKCFTGSAGHAVAGTQTV